MSDAHSTPLVKVTIDGQELQVEQGSMIIEAADYAGIRIPRFCYHKKLSVAANCRMCLVDVENSRKPTPACATPVTDGMKVQTKSEKAIRYQKSVMEFLLINHPLDCPICDQGGECELQDVAMGYGQDVSRFAEGKRSVKDKDIGPLIATDLTRCIHCTRCVRFGIEVSGQRELGMTGRGEHVEIGTFLEHQMDSEVSGNVIDLCPVGALTAKPSRYQARPWELVQKPGLSPHDCLGSHLYGHVRRNTLMRVVPRENEALNEVWLSDRDRFSYEAVHSPNRLKSPMIKRGSEWETISWEKAFEEIVNRLQTIQSEFSVEKIGALLSPSATLEEAYLLQKLLRSIGSSHIDHRLKMTDSRLDQMFGDAPGLDHAIEDFETSDAVLLVGSHIRSEVPLLSLRLRKAALSDSKIMMINPYDTDPAMPLAVHAIVEHRDLGSVFAQVLKVIIAAKPLPGTRQKEVQDFVAECQVTEDAKTIAQILLQAERPLIVLGGLALNYPEASRLQSISLLLREALGAKGGVLTEGANAQGAWLAGAVPHRDASGKTPESKGASAREMLSGAAGMKAFILLNTEPEFDSIWGAQALSTLKNAPFVVALSSFNTPGLREYGHLLLPISTFAENEGTYVNVVGSWQSFSMMRQPDELVKPAWKVLRVMANFLGVEGFDFNDLESVRLELKALHAEREHLTPKLVLNPIQPTRSSDYQRVLYTPIYAIDPVVRQSKSLQATALATQVNCARISPVLAEKLHINGGDRLNWTQGNFSCSLNVKIDAKQPENTVCIPTHLSSTLGLPYQDVPLTVAVQTLKGSPVKEGSL